MRAQAVARSFELASKSTQDLGSNSRRQSSVFSFCWWNPLSSRPAGKQTEKVLCMHTQSGRRSEKYQAPVSVSPPKVVGAKKEATKSNGGEFSDQSSGNTQLGGVYRDIHAPLGSRNGGKDLSVSNKPVRKRSTSPFAKLGALINEEAKIENVEGMVKEPCESTRGAEASGQNTGLQSDASGHIKDDTQRTHHENTGASDAVAGKHGVASQNDRQAGEREERESGGSRGPSDGISSSSGRTADIMGPKTHLRTAVSKLEPGVGTHVNLQNDSWNAERDPSGNSTDHGKDRTQQRDVWGPGDIESHSDVVESESVMSADDDDPDPLDWFDGASLSDSETLDDDIPFPPPPKKLGSPPPSSGTTAKLDRLVLQRQRQPPPPRQRQVSAARQTADVSARRGATRVATSRILEASDFAERTSVDLFHWGGDADVAPAVLIYSKQRGGERAAQRPPWKRERHKAKTHEDHRRRALERKSQLALAGLPLHLEADDENEEPEMEAEAKAEPKSEPRSYSGMRCEVCRRLKKGGCGTARARPRCLKRLLLFPRAEEEEVEASTSLSEEDQAADEVRRSLGLRAERRFMFRYLYSLGLDRADLARVLDKSASTFRLSVAPVRSRVDFLRSVGVTRADLRSVIVRQPTVLRLRVDRVMQPRINFLKRLGVPEDDIAKVITRSPSLVYVKPDTLNSKVRFMTETVGLPYSKVIDILRRHPQIFVKNIEAGLQPTVDYFTKEVGVSRHTFAKLVTHHPQLLQYSLADGIKPRIAFLRSIGLTPEETLVCITRFAQLLSLSVDTCLRPKYEYLVSHLGGSPRTVVQFPAYFSLSLDLRIIPRYNHVRKLAPGEPFPTSDFMRFLRLKEDEFLSISAGKEGLRRIPRRRAKSNIRHNDESNDGGRRIRRQGEEKNQEGSSFELDVVEEKQEAIAAAGASNHFFGIEGTPSRFRRQVPR